MPTLVKTRRKASGRSQAAVQAQMPPLLAPAMARSLALVVRRDLVGLLDVGKDFVEEEPCVGVAESVVFVTAVEAVQRIGGVRGDASRRDE